MKRTQTDGKIYHVHGLEELILLKWLYYPRQSTDSVQSLSNTFGIFHRARRNNSKFVWKHKRSWIAKTILRKKNKLEVSSSWFQSILQSYSNQNSMVLACTCTYAHANREKRKRIENPEMNPYFYEQLIYDKGDENTLRRKDSLFNKWYWEN